VVAVVFIFLLDKFGGSGIKRESQVVSNFVLPGVYGAEDKTGSERELDWGARR
jgi:hypothetical protein